MKSNFIMYQQRLENETIKKTIIYNNIPKYQCLLIYQITHLLGKLYNLLRDIKEDLNKGKHIHVQERDTSKLLKC